MKINEKNVRERLDGVPDKQRSHIYYAGLILEFLDQNFVPTIRFLPTLYKVFPGTPIDNADFSAASKEHRMKLSDLYDLYLHWRNVKEYTTEVETRFKFSIIVRHLRLYKNNWEFNVHRVGTGQVWFVGPIALIKDLPAIARHTVEPSTIGRGTVEIDMLMPPDRNWREARNWVPTHDWKVTEFEIEE